MRGSRRVEVYATTFFFYSIESLRRREDATKSDEDSISSYCNPFPWLRFFHYKFSQTSNKLPSGVR